MSLQTSRYVAGAPASLAEGWTCKRVTAPSGLFGANGLRTGPDGRIYVAQVSGSQISAIDVATGAVEAFSPMGGDIVAPDDIAFDDHGNLYATEITEGRVSVRARNGSTRVLWGDMPCANPITVHKGRVIAGECRVGARIMELDLHGGAPRIILDNVPMANAFDVGPDGKLYFPVMGTNEIWRIGLDGGAPEVVAKDLGVPDSVKFDARGRIVSTQVASGQVLRLDVQSGAREVLAQLTPGLDNVTFVGERIFVSNISGYVKEIVKPGETRDLVADGFNWPLGLAVGDDGAVFAADGPFCYLVRPGESRRTVGFLFTPGYPGYTRGVAAEGAGAFIVTTATGAIARFWPEKMESEIIAKGFDQLYGVAIAPNGAFIAAEQGTGRVVSVKAGDVSELARGLKKPSGVAIAPDGACYVTESGGGRIVKVAGGRAETVLDGLRQPQGVVCHGGKLYVVDAGAKELVSYDLASRTRAVIASGLAVGPPPGVTPKFLGAIGDMSGPMGPFAGIAVGRNGALYISADAEGSVIELRRT